MRKQDLPKKGLTLMEKPLREQVRYLVTMFEDFQNQMKAVAESVILFREALKRDDENLRQEIFEEIKIIHLAVKNLSNRIDD